MRISGKSSARSRSNCGPEVEAHLEAVREYERAGYDHVVLANNGPDPDGFMDFFATELRPALVG